MPNISSEPFTEDLLYTSYPSYIQFYPTVKCNLSCAFCFNRGVHSKAYISVMDFERFISLISDIGVTEIDILGGEPTLHPEFISLIGLVVKRRIKATVSSNGTNVHILEKIINKYDSKLIQTGISLNSDSIHKELHEYILKHKPVVKSVCLQERILPEVARYYLELSGIQYYLLYMDTLCDDDLKRSIPFYEFYKIIHALKNIYKNIEGVFCSGYIPDTEVYPFLQHVRCPAGTTKISILPDGSVYPCYLFFRNEGFKLGNIFIDDFDKIWKSPILNFFRRFEKNKCPKKRCELFSLCHGGCPAVSFLIYGDINAPDPRCVLPSSS